MTEIEKRTEYISERLKRLRRSIERYESEEEEEMSYILLKAIERDAEEIVESGVRINKILLEHHDIIPQNYRDSFVSLHTAGVLDEELAEKLANTVGFRNRLAHEYMELDPAITIRSAKNILELYPVYLRKVLGAD